MSKTQTNEMKEKEKLTGKESRELFFEEMVAKMGLKWIKSIPTDIPDVFVDEFELPNGQITRVTFGTETSEEFQRVRSNLPYDEGYDAPNLKASCTINCNQCNSPILYFSNVLKAESDPFYCVICNKQLQYFEVAQSQDKATINSNFQWWKEYNIKTPDFAPVYSNLESRILLANLHEKQENRDSISEPNLIPGSSDFFIKQKRTKQQKKRKRTPSHNKTPPKYQYKKIKIKE